MHGQSEEQIETRGTDSTSGWSPKGYEMIGSKKRQRLGAANQALNQAMYGAAPLTKRPLTKAEYLLLIAATAQQKAGAGRTPTAGQMKDAEKAVAAQLKKRGTSVMGGNGKGDTGRSPSEMMAAIRGRMHANQICGDAEEISGFWDKVKAAAKAAAPALAIALPASVATTLATQAITKKKGGGASGPAAPLPEPKGDEASGDDDTEALKKRMMQLSIPELEALRVKKAIADKAKSGDPRAKEALAVLKGWDVNAPTKGITNNQVKAYSRGEAVLKGKLQAIQKRAKNGDPRAKVAMKALAGWSLEAPVKGVSNNKVMVYSRGNRMSEEERAESKGSDSWGEALS